MIKKVVIFIGGDVMRFCFFMIEIFKGLVRFLNKFILEYFIFSFVKDGIEEVYFGVRGYVNYMMFFDYF